MPPQSKDQKLVEDLKQFMEAEISNWNKSLESGEYGDAMNAAKRIREKASSMTQLAKSKQELSNCSPE